MLVLATANSGWGWLFELVKVAPKLIDLESWVYTESSMGQPVTKSRFVPQMMVQSIVPSTSEVLLRIHPTSFVSVSDKAN